MIKFIKILMKKVFLAAKYFGFLVRYPLLYPVILIKKCKIIKKCDFTHVDVRIYVDSLFEVTVRTKAQNAEAELVEYIRSFEEESVFFDMGAN